MATTREQSRHDNTAALRALRTAEDRDNFVRNRARTLAEHLANSNGEAAVLNDGQRNDLELLLGLLDAWGSLSAELHRRAGYTRTVFDSDNGDAEQERVGSLTEC